MSRAEFDTVGWARFGFDQTTFDWVTDVKPIATALSQDADLKRAWLRHGDTWFAGVNVLGASDTGQVHGSMPLQGAALDFVHGLRVGWRGFDTGQVSICYPGYPVNDGTETEAAARFRRNRDAAHLDGLLRRGAPPRRFLGERHAFVLGLPITDAGPEAAPLCVWEGSHLIMADMLQSALRGVPEGQWGQVDLTEAYVAARKRCFETCNRVEVYAKPGEAYVVHRFALHGVAPWRAGTGERAIVYFRPHASGDWDIWLDGA